MTDKKIPVESVTYSASGMPSGLSVATATGAFSGTPSFPSITRTNFDNYPDGRVAYTPTVNVTTPYGSTSKSITIWLKKSYSILCQPTMNGTLSSYSSAGSVVMSLDEIQERISDGTAKQLFGLGAVFTIPVRTVRTTSTSSTNAENWYFQVVHFDDNYRYYGQDPSTPSKHVMYLRTLGPVPQFSNRQYGLWFDGAEPDNPDEDRQTKGNNDYTVSTLRQWLNSEEGTEDWWTAQHEYDFGGQGIDADYQVNPASSYWRTTVPGFAYMCFPDFVNRLQSVGTARTVVVDSNLNRRMVVTDDKFFPMSLNNIGLYESSPNGMIADAPDAEGVYFDYFKAKSGVYEPFDVSTLEYVYDEDSPYYSEDFTSTHDLEIGRTWRGLRYWYENGGQLTGNMDFRIYAKNVEKFKAIQTNIHLLPLPTLLKALHYISSSATFTTSSGVRGVYVGSLYRSGVLNTTCDVFTHKFGYTSYTKTGSNSLYFNQPGSSILDTCHANQYSIGTTSASLTAALATVNYSWAVCILPGK